MPSDEHAERLRQNLLAHLIERAKEAVLRGDYLGAVKQLGYATAAVGYAAEDLADPGLAGLDPADAGL
jgi:hypothetical protein